MTKEINGKIFWEVIKLAVSFVVIIMAFGVAWGVYGQKQVSLEKDMTTLKENTEKNIGTLKDKTEKDIVQLQTKTESDLGILKIKVEGHSIAIATQDTKLDSIQKTVDRIEQKFDKHIENK
jgi:uncharacterized protein HemX